MRKTICLIASLFFSPVSVNASDVVASIKPVHSLVAAVMEGVAKPSLIVQGFGSPHDYSLKPSDAKMMAEAKVIFWIGPEMETFLQKPMKTLGEKAQIISFVIGENAEHHDHDDHDDHDEHGEDVHIWLDPVKAKAMVSIIADALIKHDPAHKEAFQQNAKRVQERLDDLLIRVKAALSKVQHMPYIVFHDGYGFFEERFNLKHVAAINLNAARKPSAKKIREIKRLIKDKHVVCVFSEPQFNSKMIALVQEGTNVKLGELDPLGSLQEDGPELYFNLIESMSKNFQNCLK